MKIYTKSGDKGYTRLYTGEKIPKDAAVLDALGAIDSSSSLIGLAMAFLPALRELKSVSSQLERIQHVLFDLGAAVATPRRSEPMNKTKQIDFSQKETTLLEEWIDAMEEELPPLSNFILPGGHPSGASLHVARTSVRHAERKVFPLQASGAISKEAFAYLNRLSDYLFVVARYVNLKAGKREKQWKRAQRGKN